MLQCVLCDSTHIVNGECADCGCGEQRVYHPYLVCWWRDVGYADDSEHCSEGFDSLVEAEEYLTYLDLDCAVRSIKCSWLDPEPADIWSEGLPF
jgi:hypothetical protein